MTTLISHRVSAPLRSVHPMKVVVLGDSLVYGYGDPEAGGWVEALRRTSMAPGSTLPVIYNLGVRGDGVAQVSQRLEQEFRLRGEIRNRVPDGIILSVGVNDSPRLGRALGRPHTPLDVFGPAMDGLVKQARQLCPVLFVGMVPVDEARMPFADVLHYTQADQWQYKEVTRQICADHGVPYLDILDLWQRRGEGWWRPRLCSDGLHPNSLGHRALLHDVQSWQPFQAQLQWPQPALDAPA